MLPDFHGLLQQSSNSADQRSLKPRSDALSSKLKSFQQFPKQRDRTLFSETDHAFFQLWTTQPSWSPIVLTEHGWKTIKSSSGKKVPLVLGTIESHYRRAIVLGKRFGKLTNYLMLDIDAGSIHHPKSKGLSRILGALEDIGLCRYLPIQSSDSEGLHLYFPLPTSINSWKLARTVHAVLSAAGIPIKSGQCELFPNKKALGAKHNGHRLPLQQGSFILDGDFHSIGNDRAVFLQQWQLCTANQDGLLLSEALDTHYPTVARLDSLRQLPPIAWTRKGESNEIMRQLVNYGDRVMGLKTIPELGDWMTEMAPQLPGYDQFASEESRNDLTRRDWAYRWAKSHFNNCREYAARNSLNYNATIAAEAKTRLIVALKTLGQASELGVTALWKKLCLISERLYGRGFSWRVFKKHRALILENVKDLGTVGLSKGRKEGKNLSSEEALNLKKSKPARTAFQPHTQLLTLRWVTSLYIKALSQFPTPQNQGAQQGAADKPNKTDRGPELDMGAEVVIQKPDSPVDGVKTRVTGKTKDELGRQLYRLECLSNGEAVFLPGACLATVKKKDVIQATAAQLLQVLGKACPFVGPGLWTVRRDEVSAKAWGQLCGLVEVR